LAQTKLEEEIFMTMNGVAKHAIGKAAKDNIFGANAAAVAAAAKIGAENVTNATIGAILDDDEKLVTLPTVAKVFRSLKDQQYFAYAPIAGLADFLKDVQDDCFGASRPEGYIQAVATAGGTGAIHHTIWNYTEPNDIVLTSNWYWGPYKVLCRDMNRRLDTYVMLTEQNTFNFASLEAKVKEILAKQDNVLLIINTPAHNPTGYSLTADDIAKVIEILKANTKAPGKKATLLLDVAYIDYAGEREEVRKFFKNLSNLPENIIGLVAYSLSKGYTMYGQRCGALLNVAATKEQSQEFFDVNQYTSRATWSNINRGAMQTMATILSDEKLKDDILKERAHYYKLIQERGDIFTSEAKACGLKMVPYIAGFFASIPCADPSAACDKLHEDNIYAVPLAAGIRVALCAIPKKKVTGMAAKIKAAIDATKK
jgi:aromatic-amino-acid transaminase